MITLKTVMTAIGRAGLLGFFEVAVFERRPPGLVDQEAHFPGGEHSGARRAGRFLAIDQSDQTPRTATPSDLSGGQLAGRKGVVSTRRT